MTEREARSQNETRNTIAKERDWQETRAARIRALIDNNPMRHAERIPEAEYHEGWAHGLSWALEQLNAEARV